MRVLFVGTANFAVPVLKAVVEAGHEVPGVVSQPDRPAGRGRRAQAGPVKRAARGLGIQVLQPDRVAARASRDAFRALVPDLVLVVAYGQILPHSILGLPRLGCYNVHGSLLPALRGAAPVNWAIIRGLPRTGVTIIRMETGLDTGDIVAQRAVEIGPRETAGELYDRLAQAAADLAVETLPLIERGAIKPVRQDEAAASLAPKLTKADGAIDWTQSASAVDCFVRGVTPWPGAYADYRSLSTPEKWLRVIVRRARPVRGVGPPGVVIDVTGEAIVVAAGQGALALEVVQPAGKREMTARAFRNGYRVTAGDRFLRPGEDSP